MIPLLPNKPLFVADLPGYGSSAPPDQHDKVYVGLRILEALQEILDGGDNVAVKYPSIVLIGHDRGARVADALHVSTGKSDVMGFQITGLALLDIVPTIYQWQIGDSAIAQVGYFHWSLLANVQIAKAMIMSYGGGRWASAMIDRWAGSNAEGREKLMSGDALTVYKSFFDEESVIEASCRDYEAGAMADLDAQTRAIDQNQSITAPLLIIYSDGFLPKRARKPIAEVWGPPFSEDQSLVTSRPIGDGIGHFLPEEAPELTAEALLDWLPSLRARNH